MDGKMLARLGAVVFVAVAVTATAIELTREEDEPNPAPARPIAPPADDPLRAGQRRCQRLGEPAVRDPECLRVWQETRDRFLGAPAAPEAPRPDGAP